MNPRIAKRLRVLASLWALLTLLIPPDVAGDEMRHMNTHAPIAMNVSFDTQGRLWRVRVAGEDLLVDVSDDRGQHFSAPTVVAHEPVAAEGEQAPEISVSERNLVRVTWTSPLPQPYAGNIRFARSTDGGLHFAVPLTVNDDRAPITHRFQTTHVAPDGTITIVWIDKRDLERAKAQGAPYRGAALYYAISTDHGQTFQPNRKFSAHSCECCRIAVASDRDGTPVAFWRHAFADGTRDHQLARITSRADDDDHRATAQRWSVEACPHHGPALAIDADGIRHGAWFNVLDGKPGLFYGRWNADGHALGEPLRFGAENASHPALLAVGNKVYLAWKSFDGDKTVAWLMSSSDGGVHWHDARAVASTPAASDHPRLVAFRDEAFLSWSTVADGYRLIALSAPETPRQ